MMVSLERFKRHVMFLDDSDDSCWVWVGALRDDGRGRIKVQGREYLAHRVAWEFLNGRAIPAGMRLTQECSHPQCVRHWRLDRPARMLTPEQTQQIQVASIPAHALAVRYGVSIKHIRNLRWRARCTDRTEDTTAGGWCV